MKYWIRKETKLRKDHEKSTAMDMPPLSKILNI